MLFNSEIDKWHLISAWGSWQANLTGETTTDRGDNKWQPVKSERQICYVKTDQSDITSATTASQTSRLNIMKDDSSH